MIKLMLSNDNLHFFGEYRFNNLRTLVLSPLERAEYAKNGSIALMLDQFPIETYTKNTSYDVAAC
jgi:hypothetical protein